MPDTATETVTAVDLPPVSPPPAPVAAPSAVRTALPGVPLAVAAANAIGTTAAGALTLGGPAALAAAAGTAGVAALGTLARRTAHRRTARTAATRAAVGTTAAAHGSTGRSTTSRTGASPTTGRTLPRQAGAAGTRSAAPSRPTPGSMRAAVRAATRRGQATPPTTAATRQTPRGGGKPSSSGRPGAVPVSLSKGTPPTRQTARHALARAARMVQARVQAGAPARQAKAGQRTEQRRAKGQEKAARQAGIAPTPGKTSSGSAGKPSTPGRSAVQGKALRRSALRHGARLAASGLAAGAVGLGSALVGNWRKPGKVSSHMRRSWQRLTTRARQVREKRDTAIRGTTAPGTAPVPAETVNDPNSSTAPAPAPVLPALRLAVHIVLGTIQNPATEGAPAMSETTVPAFSLSAAADVLLQAATTWDPDHMNEFGVLVDDLPVAYGTLQEALRVLTEKASESLPVHATVVEEIGEGYQAMGKVVAALENVGQVYRQAHADDLERLENPRNGLDAERKWNV